MPDPELHEVASGVFAYVQPDGSWMLNNTGFLLAGEAGHLLVDTTSTEARNRALLSRIREVAGDDPPRALVNTHHHGDHTYGNWLLPARTPIFGHVHCREDVLEAGLVAAQVFTGPDYGHQEVRPPDTTFDSRMTLYLGERRVDLIHVGPAHTRSDVLVWLPEERVVFCGDLVFNGGQPFLLEGSVASFPRALRAMRDLDAKVLVPGHGPVCSGDDVARVLDDMADYVAFVERLGRDGHAAGRTPLEAARAAELGRFASWQEGERLVGNLYRAYHELAGNPVGSKIPLVAAIEDMVALHGGPIPCFA
ncbi:MAG: MBL fold metallo-hydrolase [Streptosporangiales bacterium]|nr:MBL fold metallo-hydrolase [Streptosporangiales bacterium]